MKDEKHFGKRVKRPEPVEEEAVEMNSTACHWEGGLTVSANRTSKAVRWSTGKPLTCGAL